MCTFNWVVIFSNIAVCGANVYGGESSQWCLKKPYCTRTASLKKLCFLLLFHLKYTYLREQAPSSTTFGVLDESHNISLCIFTCSKRIKRFTSQKYPYDFNYRMHLEMPLECLLRRRWQSSPFPKFICFSYLTTKTINAVGISSYITSFQWCEHCWFSPNKLLMWEVFILQFNFCENYILSVLYQDPPYSLRHSVHNFCQMVAKCII